MDRARGSNADWSTGVFSLGIVLGLATIMFYSGLKSDAFKTTQQFKEQLKLTEKLQTENTQAQITRLMVQVASPATLGKEVEVECYVENLSTHPFTGVLVLFPPMGWERQKAVSANINIGAESRKVLQLTVAIPNTAQPGKYQIAAELTGAAFDEPVRVWTKSVLEVRP